MTDESDLCPVAAEVLKAKRDSRIEMSAVAHTTIRTDDWEERIDVAVW